MEFTFKKSDDEMDDTYQLSGTNIVIQVAYYNAPFAFIVWKGTSYQGQFKTLDAAKVKALTL